MAYEATVSGSLKVELKVPRCEGFEVPVEGQFRIPVDVRVIALAEPGQVEVEDEPTADDPIEVEDEPVEEPAVEPPSKADLDTVEPPSRVDAVRADARRPSRIQSPSPPPRGRLVFPPRRRVRLPVRVVESSAGASASSGAPPPPMVAAPPPTVAPPPPRVLLRPRKPLVKAKRRPREKGKGQEGQGNDEARGKAQDTGRGQDYDEDTG